MPPRRTFRRAVTAEWPTRDQAGQNTGDRLTAPLEAADSAEAAARAAADLALAGDIVALETAFLAHETRHRSGGADPLSVLNLAGYPGGTATFLRADGSFAAPAAGAGDVVGPAGATDEALARFDTATGKLLQDSSVLVDNSGNMTLPASSLLTLLGGQIKFPASLVATADPNTLDDYERGSWSPGIGGNGGESGQAYSLQKGRYLKVGRLVICWGRVTLSTRGTITSFVEITGFPFTNTAETNIYGAGLVPYWASLATAVIHLGIALNVGGTRAALYATTAAATSAGTLAQADLSNTSDLIFSCTYHTD